MLSCSCSRLLLALKLETIARANLLVFNRLVCLLSLSHLLDPRSLRIHQKGRMTLFDVNVDNDMAMAIVILIFIVWDLLEVWLCSDYSSLATQASAPSQRLGKEK